ncbi:MAG: hypothetical protein JWP25_9023 [Bradyrhizobium sp.]|nr:hypothetical protein [Bradyrhizobium sp.]
MTHRHSWSTPTRPSHLLTIRVCIKCGLEKRTRHESPEHWTEFRLDGRVIETESRRTPGCMVAEVAA